MTQQRSYRAACPGCGAPVEFRSATSTHAVCGYCQSTVARDGETLSRVGRMAALFDDHSPLQLLATGVHGTRAFTVVGRLQYRYAGGVWSEWRLVYDDDGTDVWLSEDNGNYVLTRAATMERPVPAAVHFRVGRSTAVGGRPFVVGSNETGVTLIGGQGELPRLPELAQSFTVVELRSERGEVLSIDYSSHPPSVYLGQPVTLEELRMSGLKEDSAAFYQGRQFSCPHCASPVQVTLNTSKSVTCPACHSVIDVSRPESGLGGQLAYAIQNEPVEPLISLGSMGKLVGKDWQVVGFQHRIGNEPGDDEHFGWDEYLLYNRSAGFRFLVDAQDGWSLARTLSAAPPYQEGQRTVKYLGTTFQLDSAYHAQTTWVAGEFYWEVSRGERAWVQDFTQGKAILTREQAAREVTWSRADRMPSAQVAQAFGMTDKAAQLVRADASPVSSSAGGTVGSIVFWVFVLAFFFFLETRCSACDPAVENCSSSYRGGGGSWGGFSTGGGHK